MSSPTCGIILSMIEVFSALGLGVLLGWKTGILRNLSLLTQVGLVVLLFSVGVQLGSPEVLAKLSAYGQAAVATSIGATGLSVVLVAAFEGLLTKYGVFRPCATAPGGSMDGTPIRLACSLGAGVIAGHLFSAPLSHMAIVTTGALCWLVFLTGLEIARSNAWSRMRELGPVALTVPLLIGVGSIVGALIAGSFFGLKAGQSMAVGAGFGWYSLSGVLISRIGGPGIGAIAFMSNLFREALTFAIVPFTPGLRVRLLGVALGGATTMDSTLPLISRFSGPEVSIIAFISGVILTLVAPLLIPLFINLTKP